MSCLFSQVQDIAEHGPVQQCRRQSVGRDRDEDEGEHVRSSQQTSPGITVFLRENTFASETIEGPTVSKWSQDTSGLRTECMFRMSYFLIVDATTMNAKHTLVASSASSSITTIKRVQTIGAQIAYSMQS